MEPMTVAQYPKDDFLKKVKDLVHKNNALLIFDEMVTGFRADLGGAQKLFNVVPDMATFGKGMANGYPLSAVVGSNEIMKKVEDIFFSGTFGGETLSLVAASKVIDIYQDKKVVEYLMKLGGVLIDGVVKLIKDHQLENIVSISSFPSWSVLKFRELDSYSSFEVRTFFLQEVLKRGILTLGSHNLSFSHTQKDIDKLLDVYSEVFLLIGKHIKDETLIENIHGDILQPLFQVRELT